MTWRFRCLWPLEATERERERERRSGSSKFLLDCFFGSCNPLSMQSRRQSAQDQQYHHHQHQQHHHHHHHHHPPPPHPHHDNHHITCKCGRANTEKHICHRGPLQALRSAIEAARAQQEAWCRQPAASESGSWIPHPSVLENFPN